ncbi:MAG: hypothetical protein J6Y08_07705 [Clostridiales bacterium]|nr:hypothetical protein [Clostridiales bacterium]
MNNVISSQSFKYLRSSAFFVIMVLMVCLAFGDFWLARSSLNSVPEGVSAQYEITGLSLLVSSVEGGIVYVIVGLLASLLICSDFSTQSIRQIIGKGTGKLNYTLGTLFTIFLFSMIVVLFYYLCTFGIFTVYCKKAGLNEWKQLLWLLLATFCATFNYTAFVMFVASLSKRVSITIPFAIMTPSILELVVMTFSTKEMVKYPLDLTTSFENILYATHKACPRIYSVLGLVALGIIFTILSIIVVKKKEY